MIPRIYNFGANIIAEKPLLSQDGSILVYEKSVSAGKFYLYSPDGNHRLIVQCGSIYSAAISPNGELIAETMGEVIHIIRVRDGEHYRGIVLPGAVANDPNWNNNVRKKNPHEIKLLPKQPSKIINK